MSGRNSDEEKPLHRQATLPPIQQSSCYYPWPDSKSKYPRAHTESCDSTSTSSDSVSSESSIVPLEVKLEGECIPVAPNHHEQNKTLVNSDSKGPPTVDDRTTLQAEICLEWSMRTGKPTESEEPKSERASDKLTLPGTVDPLGKRVNGDDHTQSLDGQSDWSDKVTHYAQLCFAEVAAWADSFYWARDFDQLVLKYASESLMILNAVFACAMMGASTFTPDEIKTSYNYATEHLLEASQETDRNSAECAVASIVLSIYETKRGEYEQSLRRIGNSRDFMQECEWNVQSTGFGLACFWLNIEIEVNNCLATNRQTVWSTDESGMARLSVAKNEHTEQIWAQSTLCFLAEVVNFRAEATRLKNAGPQHEQTWAGHCSLLWHKFVTLYNSWAMAKTAFGCVETTSTILHPWKLQQTISIVDFRFLTSFDVLSKTYPNNLETASGVLTLG